MSFASISLVLWIVDVYSSLSILAGTNVSKEMFQPYNKAYGKSLKIVSIIGLTHRLIQAIETIEKRMKFPTAASFNCIAISEIQPKLGLPSLLFGKDLLVES